MIWGIVLGILLIGAVGTYYINKKSEENIKASFNVYAQDVNVVLKKEDASTVLGAYTNTIQKTAVGKVVAPNEPYGYTSQASAEYMIETWFKKGFFTTELYNSNAHSEGLKPVKTIVPVSSIAAIEIFPKRDYFVDENNNKIEVSKDENSSN